MLILFKNWLHAKNWGGLTIRSTATVTHFFIFHVVNCVPHWCREKSSLSLTCLIFSILFCVCVLCRLLHTLPVSSHSQTQSEHAQPGCSSWNSKMFMNTNEAAARLSAPRVHVTARLSSVFQCKPNMSGSVVWPVRSKGCLDCTRCGDELFVKISFCFPECHLMLVVRLKSN